MFDHVPGRFVCRVCGQETKYDDTSQQPFLCGDCGSDQLLLGMRYKEELKMTEEKYLKYDKQDTVGVLTINTPPLNIVGYEFFQELGTYQEMIEKDKSVRALVINAVGDHFSAGIDLKYLKGASSKYVLDNILFLQRLYGRWQEWAIPVIAAVHGMCIGSAVELIAGCDLRVAADNAKFSLPEVNFGLSPDMGGTTRITKLVGPAQAKRLIMLCEEVDAVEALRIGLVEYVVPAEKLTEKALKLARRMASSPPAAVGFAKKGINLAMDSSVAAGLLFEQAQSTYCCGTSDQKEAISAFLEKRKPKFD